MPFLNYEHQKLKLREFSTGRIVAMKTIMTGKNTVCKIMIGHLCDTNIAIITSFVSDY